MLQEILLLFYGRAYSTEFGNTNRGSGPYTGVQGVTLVSLLHLSNNLEHVIFGDAVLLYGFHLK